MKNLCSILFKDLPNAVLKYLNRLKIITASAQELVYTQGALFVFFNRLALKKRYDENEAGCQRILLHLVKKMRDEVFLKIQIERYQQKIFALTLYLIGGDRDKAYDIAVSSFVEAIRVNPAYEKANIFLTELAGMVVKKSRNIKTIPYFDESDFIDLPEDKQKSLSIVRRALQLLPFEIRTPLLLRDQLHLSYKNIASILHVSKSDARSQTTRAQVHFREKIEEVLNGGE